MAKKLLQRVVWNSAGWRRPTGAANDGGYFAENGFGHEEWNLQTEDAVDGDVLGYVYWEPGEKSRRDSGGVFDIGFWAIHPETRRRLLVGRYAAARPANHAFRERVLAEFEERGVFERRASELRAAVPGLSQREADKRVRESIELGWMRFRCPVSSVVALEPSEHIELPERLQTGGVSLRFASPTFVADFPDAQALARDEYGRTSPLAEDAYCREVGAQLRMIVPLHNALSNAFAKWVASQGFVNVRQEAFRVDVEFGVPPKLHRAELKACHGVGTTKAIREALGQLLEYNHYGLRTTATTWWVVLDQEPTARDKAFVDTLRAQRGLPLVLAWKAGEGFATDVAARP